jgi:hypothetical protein
MQRASVMNRFLSPLLLALIVLISSRIAYLHSSRIDDQAIYHLVAIVSGMVQFASVVLVAVLVYPVGYFRGATPVERVMASSTNLAVWLCIDTYHVSQAFGGLVLLYYGVNIGLILFAWKCALMGVLELCCRHVAKRRGQRLRVVTPLPFIPVLVFVLVVWVLSWEGGAYYFNRLLDGYLILFRS